MQKQKVLVVDDDECNRFLLERTLSKDYDIRGVASGEDCLEMIAEFTPDVFLLDVLMPGGMDGFELCQKIRNKGAFNSSLIIFLSGLDQAEKKVYGYQVGADDFMSKELGADVLKAKIDSQLKRIKATNDAMSMAMIAMTNAGEIGQVALFYERLNDASNYRALAEQVIEICKAFDVSAAIQVRLDDSIVNVSTSGIVNTLEDEFMLAARNANRIHTLGKRCLFNFKGATLLIRIMPEDADKAGRFRDHFASVMNGVEARMRSLHAESFVKSQNESLVLDALKGTHSALDCMMLEFKKHDLLSKDIIEKLIGEMHLAFSYLNLDEGQEEYLMNVVNQSMNTMTELSSAGIQLDRRFENVTSSLEKLLSPLAS